MNEKPLVLPITLALYFPEKMYRHNLKQMEFEDFNLPFDGKLRSDNRWVKMAKMIPWSQIEPLYVKSLSGKGKGPPAMSVRVALGTLIIKERLGLSDEETVEQIRENPFLQYFLGFKDYNDEKPFDSSMLVHFRKRLSNDLVCQLIEQVNHNALEQTKSKSEKDDDSDDTDGGPANAQKKNKGKLLISDSYSSRVTTIKIPEMTNTTNLVQPSKIRMKRSDLDGYGPTGKEVVQIGTHRAFIRDCRRQIGNG